MKLIAAAALTLGLITVMLPTIAYAGDCDHSTDTAKDGSNCGGRAADQWPGGK